MQAMELQEIEFLAYGIKQLGKKYRRPFEPLDDLPAWTAIESPPGHSLRGTV